MELMSISWDMFVETGDIDAYLLYKSVSETNREADVEIWESSKKKVS